MATSKKSSPKSTTQDNPDTQDPSAHPPLADAEGNISDDARRSLENAAENAGYPTTSGDLDENQGDSGSKGQ